MQRDKEGSKRKTKNNTIGEHSRVRQRSRKKTWLGVAENDCCVHL